jgi:hypothetical protein
MKVPKGQTVKQLQQQISLLRPDHTATAKERARARESLKKRCPYLFVKRGEAKL